MNNTDNANPETGTEETAEPVSPTQAMTPLARLAGTWRVSGQARGTISYEWMPGGHFLLQHVDLDHGGHRVRGMEVIGYLQPFMGERSEHVHSRFYGGEGETYDYVYEISDDTLTIWGGEKGSPSYFHGQFDDQDRTVSGAWVWPGGGYDATMTRVG